MLKSASIITGTLALAAILSPAAVAAPASELSPTVVAPTCVVLKQWREDKNGDFIKDYVASATNNCVFQVNFKIIWGGAPSSPCFYQPPGTVATSWRAWNTGVMVEELRYC